MDADLIKRWAASPHAAEQIAAGFARKIASGQLARWDELPASHETADDYGVSARTVGQEASGGSEDAHQGRGHVRGGVTVPGLLSGR